MATKSKKDCKYLNAKYLFSLIYERFSKIPDHRHNHCEAGTGIPFINFTMSALAMIHHKCRSLRAFDSNRNDLIWIQNNKNMYHIKDGRIPSDTRMREGLDPINSTEIRKPFKKIFSVIQRSGALKRYKFRCG